MSPPKCCVPLCDIKRGQGIAMHAFPNPMNPSEIERFRTWVLRIGGNIVGKADTVIYNNARVCHRHFEAIYTYPNGRLKRLAIPTLNLPGLQFPSSGRSRTHTAAARDVPLLMDVAIAAACSNAVPAPPKPSPVQNVPLPMDIAGCSSNAVPAHPKPSPVQNVPLPMDIAGCSSNAVPAHPKPSPVRELQGGLSPQLKC